jgi:hypothetical protein
VCLDHFGHGATVPKRRACRPQCRPRRREHAGFGTLSVTVTETTNDHSVAWGVGKVEAGFHAIPTSFSITITDLTHGARVVHTGQGRRQRHAQPADRHCTESPETATAGELGIPGINPNDVIQFAFSAQVVIQQ